MFAKALVACLVLLPGVVGCGDASSPAPATTMDSGLPDALAGPDGVPLDPSTGACIWSADFNPGSDEYALGCWAHQVTAPCQIPIGDTIGTDGMIVGPDGTPATDQSCRFACVGSEFALHCVGSNAWPDSFCETRTAPDSSLGCRILPVPTPDYQSYYCCPCGGGQGLSAGASVSFSMVCR